MPAHGRLRRGALGRLGSCLLSALLALAGACERAPDAALDREVLRVWFHAGRESERATLRDQIARFNAAQNAVYVHHTVIPEGSYNGQVQAAALAGDLPDLLEFDGPFLYNYAWQGALRPLDGLLPEALREQLLPSIIAQGTYRGRLYSVGTFDSGLGLYARRSRLATVGARVPREPEDAWSVHEFERVLAALAARDADGAVLDLKLNYTGEWFTYAFSPAIQSAGGDLIDRSEYRSAAGVLDGPQAVAALRHIQSWIRRGYVDPNLDDAAFTGGRVTLSWAGHWEYARYRAAAGDDLVVVPLPDFGEGARTGQGSWNWGIPASSRNPQAAMRFLAFILRPEEVLRMSRANGAVPATHPALERSRLYGPGGPLRLFALQLTRGYAVPRPRTPAYPVISSAFEEAFLAIRNGADVQRSLNEAVGTIDRDIRDNRGYPPAKALAP